MFLPDDPHALWPLFQRVPAYGPRWSPISALLGKDEDTPLYNAFAQAWRRRVTSGPQPALVGRLVRWAAARAGVPADRVDAVEAEAREMLERVGQAPPVSAWGPAIDCLVTGRRLGQTRSPGEQPPVPEQVRAVHPLVHKIKTLGDAAVLARRAWKAGRRDEVLRGLGTWPFLATPVGERLIAGLRGANDPNDTSAFEGGFLVLTVLYLLARIEGLEGRELPGRLFPEERDGRICRPMRLWLERLASEVGAESVEKAAALFHNRGERHAARFLAWERRPKDVPSSRTFRAIVKGLAKRKGLSPARAEALAGDHCQICVYENLLLRSEAAAARVPGLRAMAFFEEFPLLTERALRDAGLGRQG